MEPNHDVEITLEPSDKCWKAMDQIDKCILCKRARYYEMAGTKNLLVDDKKVLNCIELMSNSNYLEKTTQQNKYRTSSMYKLRWDMEHVTWKKMFFSNYARSRALFVMWMSFLGRLPTKDRITHFRINNDELRNFCKELAEDMDHIFFKCFITNQI